MVKKDVAGISIASVLVLIMGIAWLVREHRKALDAQCVFNLICIDSAKKQWAWDKSAPLDETPTTQDIHIYNSRNQYPMPVCPRGGTYKIGRVTETPTCSFPGHVLTDYTAHLPKSFGITHPYPDDILGD